MAGVVECVELTRHVEQRRRDQRDPALAVFLLYALQNVHEALHVVVVTPANGAARNLQALLAKLTPRSATMMSPRLPNAVIMELIVEKACEYRIADSVPGKSAMSCSSCM